jgi:acyl-CoA thioester hydrolase
MDMLGHVNNVTYVDYLQEARIDMFAMHAGSSVTAELAEGVVVVRHEVEFVSPLVYRDTPVRIDVWVTEVRASRFTLAYEIYDEIEDGRRVYLRASSVLAPYVFTNEAPRRLSPTEREILGRFLEPAEPRPVLPTTGSSRHVHPMRARFSDVDIYRHVNNVKYFEYFQESRVDYVFGLFDGGESWGAHVVARTDVDYFAPILFRLEPYAVHSWISRVGERSLTVTSEIRDGDRVLAKGSVVMVTFDAETQRSAPMSEGERRVLLAELTE